MKALPTVKRLTRGYQQQSRSFHPRSQDEVLGTPVPDKLHFVVGRFRCLATVQSICPGRCVPKAPLWAREKKARADEGRNPPGTRGAVARAMDRRGAPSPDDQGPNASSRKPGSGSPPSAPTAGMMASKSSARPSPFASVVELESPGCPFGTKSCGWSNGARR